MRRVMPGDALRIPAADWNRVAEVVEEADRQRRDRSAADPGPGMQGTTPVYNAQSITIPRYALLFVWQAVAEDIYIARRPHSALLHTLGIAAEPILPGAFGRVWRYGRHPMLCMWAYSVRFPSTAISARNSYYAEPHSWGNIELISPYVSPVSDSRMLVIAELRG